MKFGIFFLFLLLWTASQMEHINRTEDNFLETTRKLQELRVLSKTQKIHNPSSLQYERNKRQQQQQEYSQENNSNRHITRSDSPNYRPQKANHSDPSSSREPKKALSTQRTKTSKMDRRERKRRGRARHRQRNDISLWIDENQVMMFSGYNMEIYAIVDGRVMPYILDPDFEEQLPVIPSEVQHVNFTWKSYRKRYYYNFDLLTSFDQTILEHPFVSINKKGRVPRRPKVFSVRIPCAGNVSGVATFGIGLKIQSGKGVPLPGTPLRLRLRKKCELAAGPDPACDEKCANGGVCDEEGRCRCPMGYMGQFCNTALCYPQCRNGGTCSSPGRCTCPSGYHGRICEGGICRSKCLNGGKCIQKDTCACQKGYYGNRCEFSKCVIPCVNGGRCRGVNKCRCKAGYSGDHCEIITTRGLSRLHSRCTARCRHGTCVGHGNCRCNDGYTGRWCRRRGRWRKRKNHRRRPKLWV